MILGVSFPLHQAEATFSLGVGAAHASYPVENLADAREILRPFRAAAAGAVEIEFILAEDKEVEFLALAHHNAEDGETWQVELFPDEFLSSSVYDSGPLVFDVADSLFTRTEPHRIAGGPVTARSGRITLSAQTAPWQIGAAIIAGFWDLTIHDARGLGLQANDGRLDVGDGVTHGTGQFSPRSFTLGNSHIDWTTEGRTFHDFQRAARTAEPFVWVRDYDDPATWVRECALVRNRSLPALNKDAWVLGGLALDMLEHLE